MWTSKLGKKYPMSQMQQSDQASQKELKRLRSLKSNNACADCGRQDNSWASISHGVFICIICSDVHRSVGTHISKVKGCTGTYLWGPDELEKMQTSGNRAAEEVYGSKKVDPGASKEQKQRYVVDKYERRCFASKQTSGQTKAEMSLAIIKIDDNVPMVRKTQPACEAKETQAQANVRDKVSSGPVACKARIPDSLFDDFFNESEYSYFGEPVTSCIAQIVQEPALQKQSSPENSLDDFLDSTLSVDSQPKAARIAGYTASLDPFRSVQSAPVVDLFADWPAF
jgi:hypothetical protein